MIASSSDHSVTPVPNPFYAIEAGVTRNLYNHKYFGVEADVNLTFKQQEEAIEILKKKAGK